MTATKHLAQNRLTRNRESRELLRKGAEFGSALGDLDHECSFVSRTRVRTRATLAGQRKTHDGEIGFSQSTRARRDQCQHVTGVSAAEHRIVDFRDGPLPSLAPTRAFEQASVLDGNSGSSSQGGHRALILNRERSSLGLLGEIEVAEHHSTHSHRNSEKRVHRRVSLGEACGIRVLREVIQANRQRTFDQQPENSVTEGWRAQGCNLLGIEPHLDELRQRASRTQYAERSVARVDQVDRRTHDALECGSQFETGGYGHHR